MAMAKTKSHINSLASPVKHIMKFMIFSFLNKHIVWGGVRMQQQYHDYGAETMSSNESSC
eukprot:846608-Amphidinium_carterae.2